MIQNRPHGHIGLATNDIEATARWYVEELGFELIGDFVSPDGIPIKFIRNRDITYELFQPTEGAAAPGKIDHYCFDSDDIEADYRFCVEKGYPFDTDGIQDLPTIWERGARYFKILSPTGEAIEFCQIL